MVFQDTHTLMQCLLCMSRCWSCVEEVLLLLGQRGTMLSWLLLLEPHQHSPLFFFDFPYFNLPPTAIWLKSGEQWCWAVCPQSPYCDGATKSRLQIRGQIPCKYPAPNTEHKCQPLLEVFSFGSLPTGNKYGTNSDFQFGRIFFDGFSFIWKRRSGGAGLSRWLIIQRWRHFPRPAEFITNHKIGSQDVYEIYKVHFQILNEIKILTLTLIS